jgi:hypothetical protein
LEIHFAERVDDVLALALCEPDEPTPSTSASAMDV